jgi:hypothetical protein
MQILYQPWRRLIVAAVVCLTCRLFVTASDEPILTKEQIKQFLLTAKVVKSDRSKNRMRMLGTIRCTRFAS